VNQPTVEELVEGMRSGEALSLLFDRYYRLSVACASSFVMFLALPGQTKADAITITVSKSTFTLSRDPVAAYPQGCRST
jgi:hypothetical protein